MKLNAKNRLNFNATNRDNSMLPPQRHFFKKELCDFIFYIVSVKFPLHLLFLDFGSWRLVFECLLKDAADVLKKLA